MTRHDKALTAGALLALALLLYAMAMLGQEQAPRPYQKRVEMPAMEVVL